MTQSAQPPCGFDSVANSLGGATGDAYRSRELQVRQQLDRYLALHLSSTQQQRYFPNGPEYIIPVAVHIVHNGEPVGTGTNISYAQVKSQIDALNAAFSNYSATANYYNNLAGPFFASLPKGNRAVDTKIRFCLAVNPSAGTAWTNAAEPGVMRYNDANASRHVFNTTGQGQLTGLAQPGGAFPSTAYFNIWVVTAIRFDGPINAGDCPGVQGYASIAGYNGNQTGTVEGVVIRSDVFGDNSISGNSFNLQPNANAACPGGNNTFLGNRGKITVHEVGHFLGLYHTFHECASSTVVGCSTTGDLVCDTDPCDQPGVNPVCGPSNMPENFMYYSTDDIANSFTAGQTARMHAMLNTVRASLAAESNVAATGVLGNAGCFAPVVMAEFTGPSIVCSGTPVRFNNVGITTGSNLANQWQWSVAPSAGVTIATPTAAQTDIHFTTPGSYTITLVASRNGTQTATYSQTIPVTACQLKDCAKNKLQWKYGRGYIAVDFSSGVPAASASSMPMILDGNQESYITESDPQTGQLLFYSNGINVYNAAGVRINTAPLHTLGGTENSNGQILCVPYPGHPKQYILVLPNRGWINPVLIGVGTIYPPMITYLVDMNGSGSVTPYNCMGSFTPPPGEAIDPIYAFGEQVTGIPHANGRDYWIVFPFHTTPSKVHVASFLLTAAGIEQKQTRMMVATNGLILPYGQGIVANAAHNRIACKYRQGFTTNYLFTASFDNSNGSFGTATQYNIEQYNIPHAGGIQFYSNTGVYLSRVTGSPSTGILDLDLVTGTATNVTSTKTFGRFAKGPDDNIYVSQMPYFFGAGSVELARIDRFGGVVSINTAIAGTALSPMLTPALNQIAWNLPTYMECAPPIKPIAFEVRQTHCNRFEFAIPDSTFWRSYVAEWDFGDGTPVTTAPVSAIHIHSYATLGMRNVRLRLRLTGCAGTVFLPDSAIRTIHVVDSLQQVPINGSTQICLNNNTQEFIYSTVRLDSASYTWSISGGGYLQQPHSAVGLNSIKAVFDNTPGPRTISVQINAGACLLRGSLVVNLVAPGVAEAGQNGDTTLCSNTSTALNLFDVIDNEQSGGRWVRLSGAGGVLDSIAASFTPQPGTTDSRFAYIMGGLSGCNLPDTSYATVKFGQVLSFADQTKRICYGESLNLTALYDFSGLGIVQPWAINGNPVANPTAVAVPGSYTIVVSNSSGCYDTVDVLLTVQSPINVSAGPDTTVLYGVPIVLQGFANVGNVQWNWTPSDALVTGSNTLQPVATLSSPLYAFYLTATDSLGCVARDTVTVKVITTPTFFMPNAFTPNGDGLNDYFMPVDVGIQSTQYFRVFNRYGQLLFATTQKRHGWDGRFKGKTQNSGNYVWMIKGVGYNGKVVAMQGSVLLIR